MTDIILHHYETSPYSEKVRLGLGLKGLAWASVEIPQTMPKPDLAALTGALSETNSNAARKRAFRFVGPVIVYAWMQAVVIVNDHETHCSRRNVTPKQR